MKRTYIYFLLVLLTVYNGFSQTIASDKNAVIHSKFRVATTNESDASDPTKAVITGGSPKSGANFPNFRFNYLIISYLQSKLFLIYGYLVTTR